MFTSVDHYVFSSKSSGDAFDDHFMKCVLIVVRICL